MRPPKSSMGAADGGRRRPAGRVDDEEGECPTPARMVKLAYGYERARWESMRHGLPVRYVFPKDYDGKSAKMIDGDPDAVVEKAKRSEWIKLASWLRENKVTLPKAFMACVFENVDVIDNGLKKARAPEPSQIRSHKCLKLWEDSKDALHARVGYRLEMERGLAADRFHYHKTTCGAEDAWSMTLLDAHLELSPLFRYCIAYGLNSDRFDRIATRYLADAIMQFERHRTAYKTYWHRLLPGGFSRRAQSAYPHLVVL